MQGCKWKIEDQLQTISASINGETFYVKDLVVVKVIAITFHGKINGFFMKEFCITYPKEGEK